MLKRTTFSFLSALLLTLTLFNPASAQSDKRKAYAVLIDNTGSLRTQFSDVLMLGKGIVGEIHAQGPVSLFNFETPGDEGVQKGRGAMIASGVEWSQNKTQLDNYLDGLRVVGGQTALLDAVSSIAEQLNAKVNSDPGAFGEKIIFLITDGEERVSKIKQKELIKTLKESGIKVYAVGLVKELEKEGNMVRKSGRKKAEELLGKIAQETGGRAVFSKSKRNDTSALLNELFAK